MRSRPWWGDAANDWDAAQVAISFATLTADVKPADQRAAPIIKPGAGNGRQQVSDARADWLAGKETAYRPQPVA